MYHEHETEGLSKDLYDNFSRTITGLTAQWQ